MAVAPLRKPSGFFAPLVLMILSSGPALGAVGGPDGFGYTWRDSEEVGFDYAWYNPGITAVDITVLGDDTTTGLMPISFGFPYYGAVYSEFAACSNGWLSLVDGTSQAFTNGAVPNAGAPVGVIAAFWDDLRLTDGISKVLMNDLGDRLVVTWRNAHDLGDEAALNNFQIILHQDGRIIVQYQSLLGDLTSCTLGIESPDELNGLTVYNNEAGGVPTTSYAVEFSPPVPVPNDLDCAGAMPVACGEWVNGDTNFGVANQDAYLCSRGDFSGREQLYTLDLPVATDARLILEPISGNPSLIVLDGCDPNRCVSAPTTRVDLTGATGTYTLVVDSPPGEEGEYRLRVECLPIAPDLDCVGATRVICPEWFQGDLTTSASNQDYYWCSEEDFSGNEDVYLLDLAAATTFRVILEAQSGNPELFILNDCDPGSCLGGPVDSLETTAGPGQVIIVVDARPGDEGAYRLRVECQPLPPEFDCGTATPLSCPDSVSGDTRTSTSNQDVYWCTELDYSGAEDVYLLDLPSPATVQIDMTTLSGNPDVFVLNGCEPGECLGMADEDLILDDISGPIYIVVDSEPGQEGAYQLDINCLQDSFTFCGDGLYESEAYGVGGFGSWLVFGWLYHPGDTHNFALRVDDGAQTYTHDVACTQFPSGSWGVLPPSGPGFVTWEAPEGRVDMTMSETNFGGCCGLLVSMEVTNTDTVPHSYDFRVYHDTAFGTGNGTCSTGTIDGGPIRIGPTTYYDEQELLPLGADTCEGQVQMTSAEDPAGLSASYEMLPPNLPTDMEFLDWNDGGAPCTTWQDMVDGVSVGQCFEDSSLLLIWRFPAVAGTLAPGESATASYRVGYECTFPCNVSCEDPVLAAGRVADLGPCNDGIELTWDPAVFPGAGNGIYHVRRSTVGFADARLQAPLTPGVGLSMPTFIDTTPPPNTALYYVVEAESLDFPGCGAGTLVMGSTDEIEIGPIMDSADVAGPAGVVGNTLRATAHTDDTVDFNWLLAAAPGPGETYRVLRADDDPQGPFQQVAQPAGQTWTDPDAPPRFAPAHVWFYDVRLADDCGNLSVD